MRRPKFRWGIVGTAEIARKNWQAIRHSGNGSVVAVASRSLARSQKFIAQCQAAVPFPTAPRALGSYEELIEAPDVDGVYIPLPTGLRKPWVLRAAAAGKHVVCEKPCAASLADLVEMTEACRRHKVQFMDGVMFMHSRRLGLVRRALERPRTVGAVRRITSAFSFQAAEQFFATNIRARSEYEPFGCLGDLGWYCIQFTLWALDWQMPREVRGRLLAERRHAQSSAPVPTEFAGELLFGTGVSAGFYCSFVTATEQWVQITGSLGNLSMPDFVLPFLGTEVVFETLNPVYKVRGCDFIMRPNLRRWAVNEHSNSHPSAQEANLFRDFAEQAQSGRLDPAWPQRALATQQVMEACLASAKPR